MRIGDRFMDAESRRIYRVTDIEEDVVRFTVDDEYDERAPTNKKSRSSENSGKDHPYWGRGNEMSA
jgi:hypothetical protein